MAELSWLARTVRAWEVEILAWHRTHGCSNGPTEAVHLLIKQVKLVGTASAACQLPAAATVARAASRGRLARLRDYRGAYHAWWCSATKM